MKKLQLNICNVNLHLHYQLASELAALVLFFVFYTSLKNLGISYLFAMATILTLCPLIYVHYQHTTFLSGIITSQVTNERLLFILFNSLVLPLSFGCRGHRIPAGPACRRVRHNATWNILPHDVTYIFPSSGAGIKVVR